MNELTYNNEVILYRVSQREYSVERGMFFKCRRRYPDLVGNLPIDSLKSRVIHLNKYNNGEVMILYTGSILLEPFMPHTNLIFKRLVSISSLHSS